jgi:hypothetical protein
MSLFFEYRMKSKGLILLLVIAVATLVGVGGYRFIFGETVLFEKELDSSQHRIAVTCRRDGMVYYPYVAVKSSGGLEVARSMIAGRGYEYLNACKNSFPVNEVLLLPSESKVLLQGDIEIEPTRVRLYFGGRRNAFGDASYVDVPVAFYRR